MSNSATSLISDVEVQSTINNYIKDTIKMKSIMECLDKKNLLIGNFSHTFVYFYA